jgi:hypothetical protein
VLRVPAGRAAGHDVLRARDRSGDVTRGRSESKNDRVRAGVLEPSRATREPTGSTRARLHCARQFSACLGSHRGRRERISERHIRGGGIVERPDCRIERIKEGLVADGSLAAGLHGLERSGQQAGERVNIHAIGFNVRCRSGSREEAGRDKRPEGRRCALRHKHAGFAKKRRDACFRVVAVGGLADAQCDLSHRESEIAVSGTTVKSVELVRRRSDVAGDQGEHRGQFAHSDPSRGLFAGASNRRPSSASSFKIESDAPAISNEVANSPIQTRAIVAPTDANL